MSNAGSHHRCFTIGTLPVTESVARSRLFKGSIMPKSHPLPDRTFDCPKCDHVREVIIATEAFEQLFIPPISLGV
jgi:hypothetical protein